MRKDTGIMKFNKILNFSIRKSNGVALLQQLLFHRKDYSFYMHLRVPVRWFVRPSVGPSVDQTDRPSVRSFE